MYPFNSHSVLVKLLVSIFESFTHVLVDDNTPVYLSFPFDKNFNEELIKRSFKTQEELLKKALKILKPGGEMVYSTCSINKFENDSQIISFLGKHKDVKRVFEKQIFPSDYEFKFALDGYVARSIRAQIGDSKEEIQFKDNEKNKY